MRYTDVCIGSGLCNEGENKTRRSGECVQRAFCSKGANHPIATVFLIVLTNTIGNPLETTIALSHLIFEGTLDRYPGLKICAVHGGGYLPSYAHRSDAVCRTFPGRVGPLPKKPPTAYLKDGQLFFDTIVFTRSFASSIRQ